MAYDSPDFKHFHPMSADPKVGAANPPYYLSEHFSTYGIAYNPKYVEGEIVHWKDVLRPQYKGKIACGDVSKSFSYTEAYLGIRKVVGVDYWKELAKQEPFLLVSASDLANKMISGEYPIVVIAAHSTSFRPNLKGAGLKLVFPPEGFAVIGSPTVILAHAPHPNAAKLWLDFNRSEIGQRVWLNDAGYPVGRPGIKSKYSGYPLAISDMKGYIEMDWREISAKDRSNAREEFRRIMVEKRK